MSQVGMKESQDSPSQVSRENMGPAPPTSERFLEITNRVYEEEYDEFMDGYRQAAKETTKA